MLAHYRLRVGVCGIAAARAAALVRVAQEHCRELSQGDPGRAFAAVARRAACADVQGRQDGTQRCARVVDRKPLRRLCGLNARAHPCATRHPALALCALAVAQRVVCLARGAPGGGASDARSAVGGRACQHCGVQEGGVERSGPHGVQWTPPSMHSFDSFEGNLQIWTARPQPRTAGGVHPGVAGLARAGAVGHHRVGAAAIDAIAHGHVVGVACARAVCKRVRACVHAQVSPLGGGGVLQGTLIF